MPSPSLRADDPCPRRRRAGTAAAHRHGVWTLPTGPAAPGHARRIVRRHLRRWRLEHAADVVELLVSELVTNALLHGDGPAVLSLRATHGGLRCAVTDDGAASPRPLPQSPDSETGRGLRLVEALSLRWGVAPRRHGKTVWCELAAAPGSG